MQNIKQLENKIEQCERKIAYLEQMHEETDSYLERCGIEIKLGDCYYLLVEYQKKLEEIENEN